MILNPLFMTSFRYHYTEEWDPVVHRGCFAKQFSSGKKALVPSHYKSTLINVPVCHGMQHFTAAAVQREPGVDAEQHDVAICAAEQAVSW